MGTGEEQLEEWVRLVPAILWALYVLYASVVDPGSGSIPVTGPLGMVGFDKWLHVGTYATFAFLTAMGLWARTGRQLAIACLAAVAFGTGMELLQYPLAARSADPFDAAANAVGAAVGLGVWTSVWWVTTAVVGRITTDRVG